MVAIGISKLVEGWLILRFFSYFYRNNGLYNNENAANWNWSNMNQNYGFNGIARRGILVSRNARQHGYDQIENVPYYPVTNDRNNGFGQRNDFVGNRGNGNFMLDNNNMNHNGGARWANSEFDPYSGAFQDNGNGYGNL